jgi:hypothetical protein
MDHIDAERLNEIWDELRRDDGALASPEATELGLDRLYAADRQTPAPEAAFLRELRATLTSAPVSIDRARPRSSFGIVATPYGFGSAERGWSKRVILFAVAAVLAIAILSSGLTFRAGGHPEIGVPTVQASSFAYTPTPVASPTVESGDAQR